MLLMPYARICSQTSLVFTGSPLSPGNRLGSPVKGGNGKTVVVLKGSTSPLRPGMSVLEEKGCRTSERLFSEGLIYFISLDFLLSS